MITIRARRIRRSRPPSHNGEKAQNLSASQGFFDLAIAALSMKSGACGLGPSVRRAIRRVSAVQERDPLFGIAAR
jgi:hypothetical protein